jgi:hypothetical protein
MVAAIRLIPPRRARRLEKHVSLLRRVWVIEVVAECGGFLAHREPSVAPASADGYLLTGYLPW